MDIEPDSLLGKSLDNVAFCITTNPNLAQIIKQLNILTPDGIRRLLYSRTHYNDPHIKFLLTELGLDISKTRFDPRPPNYYVCESIRCLCALLGINYEAYLANSFT